MTLAEALAKAKEQYAQMQNDFDRSVQQTTMIRETMLRQEGYITALEQVVEGSNGSQEESATEEVDSKSNGKHEEARDGGEFAQSLGRAKRRADPRSEVGTGVAE